MAKKNTPAEPKNDFAVEDELDLCGFSDNPIIYGECIASYTFDDDSSNQNNELTTTAQLNTITTSTSHSTKTIGFDNYNNENLLTDNRKTPIINGCAPPINGEYLDTKRTYMLRCSTVRKLNELKSLHPDLNTYVSTLVDLAIAHYYDHIVNNSDTQ